MTARRTRRPKPPAPRGMPLEKLAQLMRARPEQAAPDPPPALHVMGRQRERNVEASRQAATEGKARDQQATG